MGQTYQGTYKMSTNHILDNLNYIKNIDVTNMSDRIANTTAMLNAVFETSISLQNTDAPSDVILAGMGGSAIASDLLNDYIGENATIPTTVIREPELPYTPSSQTLLVVNSFSGNTEESISVFHKGYEAGCRIVVVTGGGKLESLAKNHNIPLIKMDVTGEPRSVVPYHFLILIRLFVLLNLATLDKLEIQDTLTSVNRCITEYAMESTIPNNLAKQLAIQLQNKFPCIYGGGLFKGMTLRWKTQINENSKSMCLNDYIPELFHNTIESVQEYESFNSNLFVLVIEPKQNPTWLQKRYSSLEKVLSDNGIKHHFIKSEFSNKLEQIMCMMTLSDYTSFYLGILKNVDPASTEVIESVKKMMS